MFPDISAVHVSASRWEDTVYWIFSRNRLLEIKFLKKFQSGILSYRWKSRLSCYLENDFYLFNHFIELLYAFS